MKRNLKDEKKRLKGTVQYEQKRGVFMVKEVYCGWVCPDCCNEYDWQEDRSLPVGHEQSCENCLKWYKQTAHELARISQ